MDDKEYIHYLNAYTQNIHLALKISKLASGRQVEDKVFWACVLYTRMCVTGLSIFILSPNSEIVEIKINHWDYSSLFSLCRNLMECYQTLFYLCVDDVPVDELKARRKLFNLHDYYSRKKLLSYTHSPKEDKELEEFVINELIETDYFKGLDKKKQKHFLKGEHSFFLSRDEIEEKLGSKVSNFKLIYKLFSSNIHSFPMGFYGMINGDRGLGIKSEVEVKYSTMALDIATQYLKQAAKNILDFLPDILGNLTEKEIGLLHD